MIKIKLIKNKLYQISPEIGSLRMISGGVWSLRKTPGISVRRIIHYKPEYGKYIGFHNFRLRKYNSYSTYSYNNGGGDGGGGNNNNNNSFFIILLFGLYYSYKK
jgi:hypothetical protein